MARKTPIPRHYWTPAQEQTLRDMYPMHTARECAAALGLLQPRQVYCKAFALELKKAPEFIERIRAISHEQGKTDPRRMRTQWKPGTAPWNKGIPYDAGGRSAETRFKPGNKPPTTQPVGALRITYTHGVPSLEQKVSDTPGSWTLRWVPVTRLVWEAAHGPVPKGHLVIFRTPALKTLVFEEITIDKLDCVTRAENARRNSVFQRLNPEVSRLYQLKGAISRQVNRINREAQQRQHNRT